MQIQKFKKVLAAITAAVVTAAGVMGTSFGSVTNAAENSSENTETTNPSKTSTGDDNYAKLLQYAMTFYDANMCGTEVNEDSLIKWRGDCHTYDAQVPLQPMDAKENGTNLSQDFINKNKKYLDPDGDGYVNVEGGLHDAGDHVEFGMPENYTAATLGWGYYEFKNSYVKTGTDKHIETILRHVNDYLLRCTFLDDDGNLVAFCYQVGDGDIDHAVWESPETDSMARPAYFLTADRPQVDYVASAAAALAINYLNFKESDPDYAKKSLDTAKALMKFADTAIAEKGADNVLSDNGDGPKQYYSSSKWEDDYVWAETWMYEATGDKTYLDTAMPYVDYYAPSGWCYCWNDMWSGAIARLAIIDQEHPEYKLADAYRTAVGKSPYEEIDWWKSVEKAITTWQGLETPGGYAFLNQWGSARYNTAMQYICLIYDKYTNNNKPGKYSDWAKGQMSYILGKNPLNRCYVCGFSDNSVKYPHHRAASGLTSAEDTREQKHVLYGALVGGPDGSDKHNDTTNDYVYNEVTIDYNAAFVGAAAGLYAYYGTDEMKPDANFPPEEKSDSSQGGGNAYWVEACGVDDLHSDGSGVTKVSFKVMTDAAEAKTDISVKYFFNSSEISDVMTNVKPSELYDQANAELTLKDGSKADGQISGPYKYDKLDNTYYVEIKFPGFAIANSGKKYQFLLGMYYGDKWDPKNDYSYDGLPILGDDAFFGNGNEVKTDKICVYSDGVLVGGTEPDGSTPKSEEVTTTTTTNTTSTTTTTSKATTTKPVTTTKITTTDANITTATIITTTTDTKPTESTIPADIYGDVDCNKEVNVADVVLLNKWIVKADSVSDQGLANANCLKDEGGIDSKDSSAILSALAGIVKLTDLPLDNIPSEK